MQTEIEQVDTTWYQRVANLFKRDSVTSDFNPRIYLVNQCVFAGSIAGFFIGGRIGARVGAVEHVETTKLAVYKSITHAQRQYQNKVVYGFFRNGCKFGWRAGVFAGLYSLLLVTFSEATRHSGSVNYLAAGACTGVVYKSLSGWRSMIVGAVIGSGLSLPVAIFNTIVMQALPEDMKEQLDVFGMSHLQTKRKMGDVTVDGQSKDNDATENLIAALRNDLIQSDYLQGESK